MTAPQNIWRLGTDKKATDEPCVPASIARASSTVKTTQGISMTKEKQYGIAAVVAVLALVSMNRSVASGQPTNDPTPLDYSAFEIIVERNIFNAQRTGKLTPRARIEARSAPRIDTVALVGTMRYEKGLFALFEGSSSEYRKVLKATDTIAGYQLSDIGWASVKLASASTEIQLSVGSYLRREDGGEWHLAGRVETSSDTPASPVPTPAVAQDPPRAAVSSSEPQTTSGEPSSQPSVTDAMLAKLMEKRKQERSR